MSDFKIMQLYYLFYPEYEQELDSHIFLSCAHTQNFQAILLHSKERLPPCSLTYATAVVLSINKCKWILCLSLHNTLHNACLKLEPK